MNTDSSTPSERLKAETASIHDSLEEHSLLRKLGSSELSAPDYVAVLKGFARMHFTWEKELPKWRPIRELTGEHAQGRRKNVSADLMKLGLTPSDIEQLELSPSTLDYVTDLSSAFGTAYVVEGSALGGLVIAEGIEKDHGETLPISFFRGIGRETKSYWKAFKAEIDAHLKDEKAIQSATEAAKRTFAMFSECLSAP